MQIVSQAEQMVKRSRVDFLPGKPGGNVAVLISLIDRGRGDPRNILGMMSTELWTQISTRLMFRLGS